MTQPKGIKHLSNYLSDFNDKFVIIGGGAAAIFMQNQGLPFRSTKDIDLLLLSNGSKEFNKKICDYVKEGDYKELSQDNKKYYRFFKPCHKEFPDMIEIFASNEQKLSLNFGQTKIPIVQQNYKYADKISAIILNDEYFNFIRCSCIELIEGIPIINAYGNICLKAHAYCELKTLKNKGENVDTKDIEKHKRDIIRLAITLDGLNKITLGNQAKSDMKMILQELEKTDERQYKMILENYPYVEKAVLLKVLGDTFLS